MNLIRFNALMSVAALGKISTHAKKRRRLGTAVHSLNSRMWYMDGGKQLNCMVKLHAISVQLVKKK